MIRERKTEIKQPYTGFLLNNDSFKMRKRFVRALGFLPIPPMVTGGG